MLMAEKRSGNLADVYAATATEPLRPEYHEPRKWFALLVTPSAERRAFDGLKRLRLMPYWPVFAKQQRHHIKGRRRVILCGVIPGYMFLPVAIHQRFSWTEVLGDDIRAQGIPGIREVVRDQGAPRALSEGDIERIRYIEAALNSADVCAERAIPFKVGDQVKFIDEVFQAFWGGGMIREIDSERRIRIEVARVLGGAPMWVTSTQIEAM